MSQPSQPTPTKRRRLLPWILGGMGAVLLLCGGFVLLGALVSDDSTGGASTPAPTTAAAAKTPVPGDFALSAKIIEQTCYGEAGCAVTWLPVVVYSGPAIPDGQTWLVRYTVSGLESGTKAGSIVMGSVGAARQSEKHGRTATENATITLKVTGVDKG